MLNKIMKELIMNQEILTENANESDAFQIYVRAKELSDYVEKLREKVNFLHKTALSIWQKDYTSLPEDFMFAVHNYEDLIPTKDHQENMNKLFEQLLQDNKIMKQVEGAYWKTWEDFEGRLQ